MTIEISLLLSGVSVAFAIFFGICSKQRNEKKDTQEDAEQRATTDTMVMVKLENIADDLKDIKRESRENREEMKTLRERVVIVGLIAVCAAGGYAVYVFVKMPSDKQLNKVREWLLYAVTKAEKELGGGTGQIKLRYVYDMFVARFAWLARAISFEAFSMMVDEALERMKKMLESNKAMQTLVSGEAGEVNE